MIIESDSVNELWYKGVYALFEDDPLVFTSMPRGMATRERLGVQFVLKNPTASVLGSPWRKLNYQFMVAEALWMLSGFNRVDLIEPYNKNIVMASDDDSQHFQGAYGLRILDQLEYVIEVLREDPDSRQAIIEIWRPRPRPSKDVPCTVCMQFLYRDGKLHMHTYMRSQDIWLGTPYDIFNFTLLQQIVACRLGIFDLGYYRHTMGSLHLYERNFAAAEQVIGHRRLGDVYHKVPRVTSLPMSKIAAAFAELTSIAPAYAFDESRKDFVYEWYDKWHEAIGHTQPWSDFLIILGRRFYPELDNFSDTGWNLLMEIGR